MRFRYEGFTKSGDVKRGYIDAERIENAAEELRLWGIFSQKLEPDGPAPMRQTLPGGQPLEPALPSTAWMDDRELKSTNPDAAPAGPPAELVAKVNDLVAQINAAEATIKKRAAAEAAKPEGSDWQKDLKDNLAIIGKVAKYCDKNVKLFADIPNPEFGKQLAVTEAVKQALMKAIHDAR